MPMWFDRLGNPLCATLAKLPLANSISWRYPAKVRANFYLRVWICHSYGLLHPWIITLLDIIPKLFSINLLWGPWSLKQNLLAVECKMIYPVFRSPCLIIFSFHSQATIVTSVHITSNLSSLLRVSTLLTKKYGCFRALLHSKLTLSRTFTISEALFFKQMAKSIISFNTYLILF
jgi:hypothetical protein